MTTPLPSDGCGQEYACGTEERALYTDTDCVDSPECDVRQRQRKFQVALPDGYDPTRPYPLVLHSDGCSQVPYRPGEYGPVSSSLFVSLVPFSSAAWDASEDERNCFDDQSGDASIEWQYFERLYDKLNADLCFDRRRVFVAGHREPLVDELACKYAGNALRPVRGLLSDTGSLPEPPRAPTCSKAPVAGVWTYVRTSTVPTEVPPEVVRTVSRAVSLAHCPEGTFYENARFESFVIDDLSRTGVRCSRLLDCDPSYPLVICETHASTYKFENPAVGLAFANFRALFEAPLDQNP